MAGARPRTAVRTAVVWEVLRDALSTLASGDAALSVLDAGGGWGDPVHIHRTVAMSEAAGVQCLEIEDQLLPRRVEHHIGIDNLVPLKLAAFVGRPVATLRARGLKLLSTRTNFAIAFPSRVSVISPPFCDKSSTSAGPSCATSI